MLAHVLEGFQAMVVASKDQVGEGLVTAEEVLVDPKALVIGGELAEVAQEG